LGGGDRKVKVQDDAGSVNFRIGDALLQEIRCDIENWFKQCYAGIFPTKIYTIKAMLGLSKVSKYVITSLTMRCSSTGRAYRPIMVTADLRLKRRQSSKCSVAAGKSVEQLVRAARRDNMKTDIYDVKSLQHYRLSDPTADSDPRPGDCR